MKSRMSELEDRKTALEKSAPARSRQVVPHPNLPELYARKIETLATSLNADNIKAEAGEIIRGLVDRVVLSPAPEKGKLQAELYGDLANILAFSEAIPPKRKLPGSSEPGSQLSVVAGARNCLNLLLSVTSLQGGAAAS